MPSVKNLFNKRGQYPLKRKDSPPIVGEGQGWGQYSENRQSIRQNLRLQTPPLTPSLEGRGVRGIPLEEVWRGFLNKICLATDMLPAGFCHEDCRKVRDGYLKSELPHRLPPCFVVRRAGTRTSRAGRKCRPYAVFLR